MSDAWVCDHVTIDTGPAAEPGLQQQQQPVAASRIKQNSGPGVAKCWGLSLYYAICVLRQANFDFIESLSH